MIELLPQVNVDWLGKRKLFLIISTVLVGVGLIALILNGGFRYGVDFQGGTVLYVQFQSAPDVERIRNVLSESGLGRSQIQPMAGGGLDNAVLIQLEQTSDDVSDLGRGRELVSQALNKDFQGKFDIVSSESVGPKAGEDLRRQAVFATLYALGGIL